MYIHTHPIGSLSLETLTNNTFAEGQLRPRGGGWRSKDSSITAPHWPKAQSQLLEGGHGTLTWACPLLVWEHGQGLGTQVWLRFAGNEDLSVVLPLSRQIPFFFITCKNTIVYMSNKHWVQAELGNSAPASVYLCVHLFIQQILMESLLCARHHASLGFVADNKTSLLRVVMCQVPHFGK